MLIILSGAATGCTTVRISTNAAQGDRTENSAQQLKVRRWFWGKGLNGEAYVSTCRSKALRMVEVRPGFGNTLISVLTLGVYCPTRVYWICAARPASEPCPETPPPAASQGATPN